MRLVHYSEKPVSKVKSVPKKLRGARMGFASRYGKSIGDKPHGFWVSDDDCEFNWAAWCESENFRVEQLTSKTEIVLKDNAKVLRLKSAADIDSFTSEYGVPITPDTHYKRAMWIDWNPIVQEYQGIVISPYIFNRRLSGPIWYYSWDCASGVIWDAKAIAKVVTENRKTENL